jgi:single-stranded-DNA-specific exonuclease
MPPQARAWRVAREDRKGSSELAAALGVPRIAAHLLMLRGITDSDRGRRFLVPSLDHISDPFLLTDMRAAVDRIAVASSRGEFIQVFGDYDVDGIAGTCILVNALRRFGVERCAYAMPSRLTEGYGLTAEHVENARNAGVDLIITVDNGINARDAARAARKAHIDLIVTDHHQIEGEPPDAVAVVNPKRDAADCVSADASGAAVAFKLAWALTGEVRDLDLVALGTVADVVPLRGENRALVTMGLNAMLREPRVGLVALATSAGFEIGEVTAEKIAFQLAPRLNAAGRLGEGLLPLELLFTTSMRDAARMSAELSETNRQRREIEKDIYDEAVCAIESCGPVGPAIVLASRSWHPGVVGIVASRLFHLYHRPVVLISVDENGLGRGSGRSNDSFDLAGALGACRDTLIRFGGHHAAAGLAVEADRLDAFRTAFEAEAARRLCGTEEEAPPLDIDAVVSLSELDPQLVKTIDQLEPFGCMNPLPVFCSHGVTLLPQSLRELTGGHIKFMVRQGAKTMPVVGFRMADAISPEIEGKDIDIAFTPRFNTWRGETSIQLILKDIRL